MNGFAMIVAQQAGRGWPGFPVWLVAAVCIAGTGIASAATYTVDSILDEVDDNTADGICHTAAGTCTLRAATMQANHVAGEGTTITLPAGIYQLTLNMAGSDGDDSGDLGLMSPLSGNPTIFILGAGAATTIIDAGTVGRILRVNGGRSAAIAGITLRNGMTLEPEYGEGGGVTNFGTLTVDHCIFSNNHALGLNAIGAGLGGAIFNLGSLTVLSTTLSDNMSTGEGAGIYNAAGALAEIRQSTLSNNVAQTTGGGISNYGTLYVSNSTISANQAGTQSGGIDNLGTANVYSSTIAFNQSNVNGSFSADGSGVYNAPSASLNLRNSVLAGNFRMLPVFVYEDCGGDLGSYGNNRFFAIPPGCAVTQKSVGSTSAVAALSELGPLRGNGGPTQTHALASYSGMIDGADPTSGCIDQNNIVLTSDQRDRQRSLGARCDIGAYEYDPDEIFQSGFD